MKYIDIHSHLNFSHYDDDRAEAIARMHEADIGTITVGTNEAMSREAVQLAEVTENMWATLGVHPTEENTLFPDQFFSKLVDNKKVVGIGECGFDYFRTPREEVKEAQEKLFVAHIECAQEHGLPLVLHVRPSKGSMDAYEDALALLGSFSGLHGVSHFFVGTEDVARRFVALGLGVSFDGPVTFTDEYDKAVRAVPAELLFAETDAPFAAPAPFRGKRNEPAYVPHIVAALARIRGEDEEQLRVQLLRNAADLFGIN